MLVFYPHFLGLPYLSPASLVDSRGQAHDFLFHVPVSLRLRLSLAPGEQGGP